MEPLPVSLIGWVFTVAGLAALMLGTSLLRYLYRTGKLKGINADYSIWNDILLLGVWAVGFLGGLGILNRKPWAATMLEYFCWVLIVLTVLSTMKRIKMLKDKHKLVVGAPPFKWGPAIAGALIVLIPVIAFSGATIYTLHDEETRKSLNTPDHQY